MPEITIKNGVVTAVEYVQCTRDHICPCGTKFTLTMNLAEGVSYNCPISVKANCPTCGEQVLIPSGHHYIENYELLTKDVEPQQ